MSGLNNSVQRTGRRAGKGQVMAIFALIAVLLFAVTGLAVDAGLSYLSYNGAERAAAAGAGNCCDAGKSRGRMFRV